MSAADESGNSGLTTVLVSKLQLQLEEAKQQNEALLDENKRLHTVNTSLEQTCDNNLAQQSALHLSHRQQVAEMEDVINALKQQLADACSNAQEQQAHVTAAREQVHAVLSGRDQRCQTLRAELASTKQKLAEKTMSADGMSRKLAAVSNLTTAFEQELEVMQQGIKKLQERVLKQEAELKTHEKRLLTVVQTGEGLAEQLDQQGSALKAAQQQLTQQQADAATAQQAHTQQMQTVQQQRDDLQLAQKTAQEGISALTLKLQQEQQNSTQIAESHEQHISTLTSQLQQASKAADSSQAALTACRQQLLQESTQAAAAIDTLQQERNKLCLSLVTIHTAYCQLHTAAASAMTRANLAAAAAQQAADREAAAVCQAAATLTAAEEAIAAAHARAEAAEAELLLLEAEARAGTAAAAAPALQGDPSQRADVTKLAPTAPPTSSKTHPTCLVTSPIALATGPSLAVPELPAAQPSALQPCKQGREAEHPAGMAQPSAGMKRHRALITTNAEQVAVACASSPLHTAAAVPVHAVPGGRSAAGGCHDQGTKTSAQQPAGAASTHGKGMQQQMSKRIKRLSRGQSGPTGIALPALSALTQQMLQPQMILHQSHKQQLHGALDDHTAELKHSSQNVHSLVSHTVNILGVPATATVALSAASNKACAAAQPWSAASEAGPQPQDTDCVYGNGKAKLAEQSISKPSRNTIHQQQQQCMPYLQKQSPLDRQHMQAQSGKPSNPHCPLQTAKLRLSAGGSVLTSGPSSGCSYGINSAGAAQYQQQLPQAQPLLECPQAQHPLETTVGPIPAMDNAQPVLASQQPQLQANSYTSVLYGTSHADVAADVSDPSRHQHPETAGKQLAMPAVSRQAGRAAARGHADVKAPSSVALVSDTSSSGQRLARHKEGVQGGIVRLDNCTPNHHTPQQYAHIAAPVTLNHEHGFDSLAAAVSGHERKSAQQSTQEAAVPKTGDDTRSDAESHGLSQPSMACSKDSARQQQQGGNAACTDALHGDSEKMRTAPGLSLQRGTGSVPHIDCGATDAEQSVAQAGQAASACVAEQSPASPACRSGSPVVHAVSGLKQPAARGTMGMLFCAMALDDDSDQAED